MPFTKVFVHYVWATKHRAPILTPQIRQLLFEHIRQNAQSKKIFLDCVNGHLDHVHCLVRLHPTQTVDTIARLIKGESAHWFNNRSGITHARLAWQNDYFAVAVCESALENVRNYIHNQEARHQKKNFDEEYLEFMDKFFQEEPDSAPL
ncbi:MAG: Transposase family [Sediminibacterium sp.]|nr:Transposase family [Sediminibacterium sp.]